MNNNSTILIASNKKAGFNYSTIEEYTAGIVLTGTEIKSIRNKKVSINDSYCCFIKKELFIKQMQIAPYIYGNIYNHEEYRLRKLLLNKRELIKIKNRLDVGISIIPLQLYINSRGIAKVKIALARGKKLFDKRKALKERELKRRLKNYSDDI